MILVIFAVCIAAFAHGVYRLCNNCSWDDDALGNVLSILGAICCIASIITIVVLAVDVSSLSVIDEKIQMYEEENSKIETQIAEVVEKYQEYETGIFTEVDPGSSMTLVAMYPNLKSDALVEKQIETYISNNDKIKSLKEDKINGSVYRWWLYFGG